MWAEVFSCVVSSAWSSRPAPQLTACSFHISSSVTERLPWSSTMLFTRRVQSSICSRNSLLRSSSSWTSSAHSSSSCFCASYLSRVCTSSPSRYLPAVVPSSFMPPLISCCNCNTTVFRLSARSSTIRTPLWPSPWLFSILAPPLIKLPKNSGLSSIIFMRITAASRASFVFKDPHIVVTTTTSRKFRSPQIFSNIRRLLREDPDIRMSVIRWT